MGAEAVGELRCLPSVFVMGVAKGGTTDLWLRLASLGPARVLAEGYHGKELNFFTRGAFSAQSILREGALSRLSGEGDVDHRGDGAPPPPPFNETTRAVTLEAWASLYAQATARTQKAWLAAQMPVTAARAAA